MLQFRVYVVKEGNVEKDIILLPEGQGGIRLKNIYFDTVDDILIACLSGEIDHHNAGSLRSEIDAAIRAFNSKHLVLDYSQVDFMDSSGIGLAMGRYRNIRKNNGIMVIVPGSEYISRIFGLSGIFGTIPKSKNQMMAVGFITEKGGRPGDI